MTILFETARTDAHFEQILQLQQENHYTQISEQQCQDDGFVFAKHTEPLLKQMAAHLPQAIALNNGQVVGYNLAMHASMKETLPSLTPMFEQFEKAHYLDQPLSAFHYLVGGQVCVAKSHRGQGLLKALYHHTRDCAPRHYQLCVTEIDEKNQVSLLAHQKMGFEVIHTYTDKATHWLIVAWDFRK